MRKLLSLLVFMSLVVSLSGCGDGNTSAKERAEDAAKQARIEAQEKEALIREVEESGVKHVVIKSVKIQPYVISSIERKTNGNKAVGGTLLGAAGGLLVGGPVGLVVGMGAGGIAGSAMDESKSKDVVVEKTVNGYSLEIVDGTNVIQVYSQDSYSVGQKVPYESINIDQPLRLK